VYANRRSGVMFEKANFFVLCAIVAKVR